MTERRRVLYVDDDPIVGRTGVRLLSPRFDATWAQGGAAALSLLESGQRFDAVVCDLHMPKLSGVEVFREIERRWPDLARRFVLASGSGLDVRTLGVPDHVHFLPKPFSLVELHAAVETVLAT
ncbi:response regulator [Myxococcota bacterium]|nr:response regulator [Myxococcota bacterium]